MANDKPMDFEARFRELEAKNAALMAALEAKLAAEPQTAGIGAAQLEQMLQRVTDAASAPTQLLASKLKPENADHAHKGPFEHPEGGIKYPKTPLAREVHYMGRVRIEDLTYEEWQALNALNASLARGQRRECRDGTWKATVSDNDAILTIAVPMKSIDDRHDLPSFLQIVEELTTGARALEPAELAVEVARLRAQVSAMATA